MELKKDIYLPIFLYIYTLRHFYLFIYWLNFFSFPFYIRQHNAQPTDVFGPINNVGVINNISFYLSQSLIQTNEIKEELFCDETAQLCNNASICFCLHRIKVKLNSIVEITLKDDSRGMFLSNWIRLMRLLGAVRMMCECMRYMTPAIVVTFKYGTSVLKYSYLKVIFRYQNKHSQHLFINGDIFKRSSVIEQCLSNKHNSNPVKS